MNEAFEAFWATCSTFFTWLFKQLASFSSVPSPHFQAKPLHDFLPLLLGRIYRLRNQQQTAGQEIYANETPFSDIPSLPMPKTMCHLGVGPLRLMRNSIHHIPKSQLEEYLDCTISRHQWTTLFHLLVCIHYTQCKGHCCVCFKYNIESDSELHEFFRFKMQAG